MFNLVMERKRTASKSVLLAVFCILVYAAIGLLIGLSSSAIVTIGMMFLGILPPTIRFMSLRIIFPPKLNTQYSKIYR